MTHQIELSAGTIEFEDTGGAGLAIVLVGGLMMTLWEDVIADLAPEQRCVAPTLPLGAHRHAAHGRDRLRTEASRVRADCHEGAAPP